MSFEIILNQIPAGYAASSGKAGDMISVLSREFSSSEDGDKFIARLEDFPRQLISLLPAVQRISESTVDHMLAIIRKDKTATLYINELKFVGQIRAKGSMEKGTLVTLDHILDVVRLEIDAVEIPKDAGLLLILSAGWRKGLFFDLTPIHGPERNYDVGATFGAYYAYLLFQNILSMREDLWREFLQQAWFPFIHLSRQTVKEMLRIAEAKMPIDEMLDMIEKETITAVQERIPTWKTHPVLNDHHQVIETAFRHFVAQDYLSASLILFPRIEGVMRSHHFQDTKAPKASQGALVETTIGKAELPPHPNSLLLPERFRSYLVDIYFAGFDPRQPSGLSRHTVSHGVAPGEVLNRKAASLGFQILLQIVALLPVQPKGGD